MLGKLKCSFGQVDLLAETALHKAVRARDVERVRFLLETNQFDVNAFNASCFTPLTLAIFGIFHIFSLLNFSRHGIQFKV